jgi:hypothetical protein
MSAIPAPADEARLLATFVDALIPGDNDFPPASTVGVQAVLAARLRERVAGEAPARLAALLAAALPGAADAQAALRTIEAQEPTLFNAALTAAYFAYYESPAVVRVLQALGHDYHDAPLPQGYAMAPFDPSRDAPTHRRGHWVATDAVRRVDLDPAKAGR